MPDKSSTSDKPSLPCPLYLQCHWTLVELYNLENRRLNKIDSNKQLYYTSLASQDYFKLYSLQTCLLPLAIFSWKSFTVHAYNNSNHQTGCHPRLKNFKAQCKIGGSSLQIIKKSQMATAHAFNPSTQEAKAGGSLWVQGQPGLQSEFQGATQRNPVLKNKWRI